MIDYIVKDVRHYCNVKINKYSPIPSNTYPFYDLTFVISGNMTYLCNGEKYILGKNDAIFFTPDDVRERIRGNSPVHFVSFNFTLNEGHSITFEPYMKNCITTDIKKLVSVFSPSHLTQHYHAKEKVANILNYILLELSDTKTSDAKNEHVTRIIRYIDEHITEDISLKVISEQMSLSKEYVSSIFKKHMNITLTDYINKRKIHLAKDLISQNNMELNDVAEYVGYKNYSYFSRLFRKYYDITPVRLKRKKKQMSIDFYEKK